MVQMIEILFSASQMEYKTNLPDLIQLNSVWVFFHIHSSCEDQGYKVS
jgi:hypothetical protein